MTSAPGFRLVGFSPADRTPEQAVQSLYLEDCAVLAQHPSADGARSFLVLRYRPAIREVVDQPQLVAVQVAPDQATGQAVTHARTCRRPR